MAEPIPVIPFVTSDSGSPERNPYLDNSGNLTLTDDQIRKNSEIIEKTIGIYEQIQNERGELNSEEQAALEKSLLDKQQLLEAVQQSTKYKDCFARETIGKSRVFENSPGCVNISSTPLYRWSEQQLDKDRALPDTCGDSTLSKINVALARFFKTLKSIKKFGEVYIYGALNKIADIADLIASTADIIAAVLKILVERIRSWLLNYMRKLIEGIIEQLFTTLGSMIKDALIDEIVKAILCKFDDIIKGLAKLVTDFLFSLVQNVVNPAFCAVEQFTNSLINNLAAQIDRSIGPVLDAINDVLGGVAKVAGSVFQAIDFILGFETFLCTQPDCPEIKSFTGNDGPLQSDVDKFNNFLNVPDSGQVVNTASGWINNFSVFGTRVGDIQSIGGLGCGTDPFACGPPRVEIFGGGGVGAVANAVVNSVGQVIGVDLVFPGLNYTSPPYVTFYDTCGGQGNNASAYSIINDEGEVIKVVMVNPGNGYSNSFTGLDEFGNPIVVGSNSGNPGSGGGTTSVQTSSGATGITTTLSGNPISVPDNQEIEVREYVACLEEIQVISTGIGYQPSDTITITPDIPNLQASVKLTEEGQIISIQLLNKPCGLSEIPSITINSANGVGAVFRPVLDVKRVESFDSIDSIVEFDPKKLIRVIDCVGK
jgi:hypothetical protein